MAVSYIFYPSFSSVTDTITHARTLHYIYAGIAELIVWCFSKWSEILVETCWLSDCSWRLFREVRRVLVLLYIQYIMLHTYTMRPMRSSTEVTLQASLPSLLYMSATIRTRFPIFYTVAGERGASFVHPRHHIYLYRQPMRPMRYFVGPACRSLLVILIGGTKG